MFLRLLERSLGSALAGTPATFSLARRGSTGGYVQPRLYHLRTSDGLEVDVVLEGRRHQLVGVEVKAAASVSAADFRGLRFLQEAVGDRLRCGVVLYTGRETLPFGPRLWAVPVSALWSGAARPSRADR